MSTKLKALINKLERARVKYIAEHGKEPCIWDFSDSGLELTTKIWRNRYGTWSTPSDNVMRFKFNPQGKKAE